MRKSRISAIGVGICLIALLATACGGSSSAGDAKNAKAQTAATTLVEGTVRIGTQYEWTNKNPYAEISGGADRNLRIVYEPLFDRDRATGNLVSVLGKSWKELDPFTYEIELYDYIHDSAGSPIKAGDVVFSFKTMIAGRNYWIAYLIADCVQTGEYTIQLKLKTPRAGAMETVLAKMPIISQASYEANDMSMKPIGSGHYVLTNYVSGSSWSYAVNKNYWQKPELTAPFSRANISNIEYKLYTETAQSSIALETGEIDVIEDVAATEFYLFEEDGRDEALAKLQEFPSHFILFLNYNADASNVFANQKLRQAVSTAIDNQALLDKAYNGRGGVAKTLGASSCADFKQEWLSEDYYDYNVDKAKKLLAEAGHAPGSLKVRLLVDNFAARVRMAQIIQSNLADIGVNVEILTYDTALYNTYKYTTDQWDMYIESLNTDDYITTIWDSALNNTKYKTGGTMGHFKDAKLQEYVLAAGNKKTRTDAVVNEARKYIYETVPSYGLIYTSVSHAGVNSVMEMVVNMSCYVQPGAFTYSVDFGKK